MINWEIKSIETQEVSREYVVEQFGEEAVSKYERDLMLGVDRPLVQEGLLHKLINLFNRSK